MKHALPINDNLATRVELCLAATRSTTTTHLALRVDFIILIFWCSVEDNRAVSVVLDETVDIDIKYASSSRQPKERLESLLIVQKIKRPLYVAVIFKLLVSLGASAVTSHHPQARAAGLKAEEEVLELDKVPDRNLDILVLFNYKRYVS
jgi:hypothetical protein